MSGDAAPGAVGAWLDARHPAPPPALRQRIGHGLVSVAHLAVRECAEGTPARAAVLAEAGLDRLRAALAAGHGRDAALDLLAADALMTYAFEAAAEAGADAVAACARAYGPSVLARLLGDTADGAASGEEAGRFVR